MTLAHDGMLEPIESSLVLPEVKDPKHWWGGHIWEDNVSTHGTWYNTTLAKADEFRSFDDCLNPKWKSKIGFSDPRVPSSGQSIWSFMWDLKGEEFPKKWLSKIYS